MSQVTILVVILVCLFATFAKGLTIIQRQMLIVSTK